MISRRGALVAGAAFFSAAWPTSPAMGRSTHTCRDRLVRLKGGRVLSYREYGNPAGPLVLYFHGTPGSRFEAGLIEDDACCAGVRLVSIDRPGMGCSTYDACRRILDWPCDAVELADTLGGCGSPFGILALSGGAPYAAACALRIPERLTHVAIVSGHTPPDAPGVCPGSEDKKIALIARHQRLGNLALGLISRRLDRKPEKVITKATSSWTAADRQLVLCNPRHHRNLIANLAAATHCGPHGAVTDIHLLGSPWCFSLGAIQGVNVSIWQGGCDPIATPSMGRYFHRHIAGSELRIDPHAGHVTMFKWHAAEILARFVFWGRRPCASSSRG